MRRKEAIREYKKFKHTIAKVSERITFILLNIKEGREISDSDHELLNALHKTWFLGEFPVYTADNIHIKEEVAIEQGLFDGTDKTDKADIDG